MPFGSEDGAEIFFALCFAGAHFAAAAGVFIAANLVFGFGDDLRDFDAVAVFVDGDEGEVGGGDVAKLLQANIFDHGLDADFHGGVVGTVDAGLEDEQVADLDGGYEVEVIHGGGDGECSCVSTGSHGADEIDELHEAAAKEVAEGVGVGGEDDLTAFRLGGADGRRLGAFRHSSIVIVAHGAR